MTRNRDLSWFWKKLDDYVLSSNLKQSKQRNSIVECFLDLNRHISAEELHAHMRANSSNAGLSKVYRTLNLLRDAGLVELKQFAEGKHVFEVISPESHHDHLVCKDCQRIIEFENDEIERLQKEIALSYGFRLIQHRLDLFGECMRPICEYRSRST